MNKFSKKVLLLGCLAVLSIGNVFAQIPDSLYSRDTTINYNANRNRRALQDGDKKPFLKTPRLGVDLDTLQFIVASPFDNWFIHLQAGVQTYIGNELVSSARWNKLNYNIGLEIGKWLIPDVSVSLLLQHFDYNSQTKYMLNPYILPAQFGGTDINDNGYYPFHAYGFGIGGLVTLDWMNFLNGYERGSAKKFHVTTPIGLGLMMNTGKVLNPRKKADAVNFEFYFTGGFDLCYYVTPHFILSANPRLTIIRPSFDYSPYDNAVSRIDYMPQFVLSAHWELFNEIYQTGDENGYVQQINHRFLPAHNVQITESVEHLEELLNELEDLRASDEAKAREVAALEHQIDSINNLVSQTGNTNLEDLLRKLDELRAGDGANAREIAALQRQIDSINNLLPRNNGDILNDIFQLAQADPSVSAVVYFPLDKHYLEVNAKSTLKRFATRANLMSSDNVYYIIGAADSLTGSKPHNWVLSQNRCKSVYNELTEVYGMNADQFETIPLGGITIYDPKELNRVAIVILKNEASSELVKRLQENIHKN